MYVTDLAIAVFAVMACVSFAAHVWDWPESEINALFMEVGDDGCE